MAWLLMSLRRSELTDSLNYLHREVLQLNRQRQRLSSFSNAIGDGSITPSEIASLGPEMFYDGLNFMAASNEAADMVAAQQCSEYDALYGNITQQQYYNNPAIAAQASLYFDENGNLDTDKMYSEFYEKALVEYVQKYVEPWLHEKENEIDKQKNELETQIELEQQELDSLKESISSQIQNSTIRIS